MPKIEPQTLGIYVSNINEPAKASNKKGSAKKHQKPLYITHI